LCYRLLRDLHSFPTRRSSDLVVSVTTVCLSVCLSLLQYYPLNKNLSEVVTSCATFVSNSRALRFDARDSVLCFVVISTCEAWISDRKSTRLNSSHVKISYAVF